MAIRISKAARLGLATALLWAALPAHAESPFPPREVLYEASTTDSFREIVRRFADPGEAMVPDRDLKPDGTWLRLTNRSYAIDDSGRLKASAVLGCKPYAFMTVPQAGYGRSLYDIYADIGYDATEILGQRGVEVVALLKNGFALFERLAEAPDSGGGPCMTLSLSTHERDLARYFVPSRLGRIAAMPYALLRALGGPDWEYRQLLESKMGMNAHFLGTGITENTLSPADERTGLPEFVGPNRLIAELPEAAVIDLGRMEFVEVHGK